MSEKTTLNMALATSTFPEALRAYIRDKADKAPSTLGKGIGGSSVPWIRNHVAALADLDNYLSGLGPEDQRLVALAALAELLGHRGEFRPSHYQESLLARLATSLPPPSPGTTLDELLAAGLLDLGEALRRRAVAAEKAVEEAEAEAERLAAELEKRAGVEEALEEARGEIASLNDEVSEHEGQKAELQKYVDALAAGEAEKPATAKKPRRTKVEGEVGVYYYETAEGRVYEIGFPDNAGKTRWKRVGPDLQEAIELRAELAGKPYGVVGGDEPSEDDETEQDDEGAASAVAEEATA